MGFLNWFRRDAAPAAPEPTSVRVSALNDSMLIGDLTDPYLAQFMRGGLASASGAIVTPQSALKNTAVFRCVSLLSYAMAMLPVHLYHQGDAREKASDHPLFKVLHRKPNGWQTAFEFRQLMQAWALLHGNAYAAKVTRGDQVIALLPMDPERVVVEQLDNLTVRYKFTAKNGGQRIMPAEDVFHLRGFTLDGLTGRSLVKQAAEAIGLALQADRAAGRLFQKGLMAGGALQMPDNKKLSEEAFERLKASMSDHEGAENSNAWMILEEGLKANPFATTAKDSQHLETRSHQVEEISRVFGVPRPLLMINDTSWGTGIDVLGQIFVRYGLSPWFEAWEQAISRCLLSDREQDLYYAKFNAAALLRGSMKDQAEFFSRGLSVNNQQPWLHVEEVRDWMDLPLRDDLAQPVKSAAKETTDDTARSA
ncbi:phage portal protein [Paracoccus laeviglucosivorans]|uniref:Phage portal protein, HK97 family n=1 Tax=Paracoccus laeviglucosivorans TaxID=1197861 RepID=A0A521E5F2_9RHOB|nr:phage portal protein [Paracoccus laeviglucosivorans]SMO79105.1 phage portal protein, HK97 family [Paracoccus laeviglucosivorans]